MALTELTDFRLEAVDREWGEVLECGEQGVELRLVATNQGSRPQTARLRLRVTDYFGQEVSLNTIDTTFTPGLNELSLQVLDRATTFQEGLVLARVSSEDNDVPLAETVFGIFPKIPPVAEEPQAPISVIAGRRVVDQLPAQRLWPEMPDYFRFDPIIAQTRDGAIHVMFQENHTRAPEGDLRAQRPTFLTSPDGQNWTASQLTLDPPVGYEQAVRAFGAMADGELLVAYNPVPDVPVTQQAPDSNDITTMWNPDVLCIARSNDGGKSWGKSNCVDMRAHGSASGLGRFHEVSAGVIGMTCTLRRADPGDTNRPYNALIRSHDGGRTWDDVSLMMPNSAECQLRQIVSGRWLATVRSVGRPGDQHGEQGELVNVLGLDSHPFYELTGVQGYVMNKRTWAAESDDEGHHWGNVRVLTTLVGDTPGELIQLHDGRVVFIYCHRYGPLPGVCARVSEDEGQTWRPELLVLRTHPHGSYPSSTVLDDDTIVSVLGYSEEPPLQILRWKLPAEF
jgi:hypothetical protein